MTRRHAPLAPLSRARRAEAAARPIAARLALPDGEVQLLRIDPGDHLFGGHPLADLPREFQDRSGDLRGEDLPLPRLGQADRLDRNREILSFGDGERDRDCCPFLRSTV